MKLKSNPADILPKLEALGAAIGTFNPAALGVSAATVAIIVGLRRFRPGLPGILIAVVLGALAVFLLKLPVETIGTRFGGIPSTLPAPSLRSLAPEGRHVASLFPPNPGYEFQILYRRKG